MNTADRRPSTWIHNAFLLIGAFSLALVGMGTSQAETPVSTSPSPEGIILPPVARGSIGGDQPTPLTVTYTGCGGQNAPFVNADYEHQVAALANAERAARGIPPLKRVSSLDDAARYHATDMGQDDYFNHDTHDRHGGNLTRICSWSDRVQSYHSNWSQLGENIAADYGTPQSVINAWMGSSGHRAAILNADYWELGVGYYTGSGSWSRYWVLDFGRRFATYPIVINSEAYSTTNPVVQLYIYGPSGAQQMRFSNVGTLWSDWQPYTAHASWTLAPGPAGTRTVHVQIDTGSQIYQSSDDIFSVAIAPPDPVITINPERFNLLTLQGSGSCLPSLKNVEITNAGGGTLDWDAVESSDWLSIVVNGDAIDATCLGASVGSFAPGRYTAAITVSAPGATNSPQTISVSLVIAAQLHRSYLPFAGSSP